MDLSDLRYVLFVTVLTVARMICTDQAISLVSNKSQRWFTFRVDTYVSGKAYAGYGLQALGGLMGFMALGLYGLGLGGLGLGGFSLWGPGGLGLGLSLGLSLEPSGGKGPGGGGGRWWGRGI